MDACWIHDSRASGLKFLSPCVIVSLDGTIRRSQPPTCSRAIRRSMKPISHAGPARGARRAWWLADAPVPVHGLYPGQVEGPRAERGTTVPAGARTHVPGDGGSGAGHVLFAQKQVGSPQDAALSLSPRSIAFCLCCARRGAQRSGMCGAAGAPLHATPRRARPSPSSPARCILWWLA